MAERREYVCDSRSLAPYAESKSESAAKSSTGIVASAEVMVMREEIHSSHCRVKRRFVRRYTLGVRN